MIVTESTPRVVKTRVGLEGCFARRIALPRSVLDNIGGFDTLLVPGALFRAFEGMDYNYRIWKAGRKMLFAESVPAYHNHGKETAEAARSLMRVYNIGFGAFYAKHAVSGDMLAAKHMYWILDGRARGFLRGREVARNCRLSAWLITGFVGYAACRCWRAVWK